jgi:malate/lactate dehydrogenase
MRRARVVDLGSAAPDDVSGADVVVVSANDGDRWGRVIRDRAPDAVVVVVGGSPQALCEATLFPRARIIGVASADEAEAVVDAVVNDLDRELEVVARCEGERGIAGEFARVPVRVGGRGIVAILDD